MKVLGYVVAFNVIILAILLFLGILSLLTLILVYEAIFISILGVFQILGSHIYRRDRYPPTGASTGWFDFRRFAKLKPEERERYRQEGKIMITIGLLIFAASIVIQFSILS